MGLAANQAGYIRPSLALPAAAGKLTVDDTSQAWIFILEGLFTVLCAIASFWIVSDFPDSAKFLSEEERTDVRTTLAVLF